MTRYPGRRYLVDMGTGQLVEAEIFDAISPADIADWRTTWKPEMDGLVQKLQAQNVPRHLWPQSHHWDWVSKVPPPMAIFEKGYALRCEGRLQGLMRVNSVSQRCRLPEQQGSDCIYVDFIETAPWNQAWYSVTPKYSLVGSVLMAAAIQESVDQGLKGRLGLHSLPQSDSWYAQRLGLEDLGLDADRYEGRLKYFEATPEIAASILNGVKFP
ncbi:GNAT family N-acetyltransferase [Stenotrophomonas sp. YAU14A_MKIMI4_1]|uniref:GNAT family N-acetyltransferase n=1 Tax=Stenotrophomonas sp. YAU14A_MKIMI4_1 TaxID=2072408 RepID=UPI00131F3CA1|nr:GNAT family N-acetyltransferase [Stenotrophomonas sp. YAU14A_MKIMI4_1]